MTQLRDFRIEPDQHTVVWPGDVQHLFVVREWMRTPEIYRFIRVLVNQLPLGVLGAFFALTGGIDRAPCFLFVIALSIVLRLTLEIFSIRGDASENRRQNWIAYVGTQDSLLRRASSGESIRLFWKGTRTLVPIPAHIQAQEGLFVCIDEARAQARLVMLGDEFVRAVPFSGSFQFRRWDITFHDGNVILERMSGKAVAT